MFYMHLKRAEGRSFHLFYILPFCAQPNYEDPACILRISVDRSLFVAVETFAVEFVAAVVAICQHFAATALLALEL